jgi:riboflavin synthase
MFTGIIQAIGAVAEIEPRGEDRRLTIKVGSLDLSDVQLGDSIAVSGVCLTAVALTQDSFDVDVSAETLRCSAGFDAGGEVNLEKALRLSDRLGGHLVSGHVDGIGEVLQFSEAGECILLDIRAPRPLAKYIAAKGSITVDGVSLTVNRVAADTFSINLIPHTLQMTTLKGLSAGAKVNLEVDMMARYAERILNFKNEI